MTSRTVSLSILLAEAFAEPGTSDQVTLALTYFVRLTTTGIAHRDLPWGTRTRLV